MIQVEPTKDHRSTGRWTVRTGDLKTKKQMSEEFDAIMVCTGHHGFPKIPSFQGEENFNGVITHAHSLKNCEQFRGKSVVVVGLGSSASDIAVESTLFAKTVSFVILQ